MLLVQISPMRQVVLFLTVLLFTAAPAAGEATLYHAPGSNSRELVIYSTLDNHLALPLIEAFQAERPDVAIRYEDMLANEIADRVIRETDAGEKAADFLFSSGMDLQLKLANDGYGQSVAAKQATNWPTWAKWQETAFALTLEPAVLVYHKPSFPDGPPQTRLQLLKWLNGKPDDGNARIGTYDIRKSSVGYLYLARDAEHFPDVWSVLRAMKRAGLQTFPTSQDIIERVADGRLVLGYNILGSYAAEQARLAPGLGMVLPKDYTVVIPRVAMVPRAAASPDLGLAFLDFLMSAKGQTLLSERLRLPSVSLGISGAGSGAAMQAALGDQLRPIKVSPGVLVYLDQAKRQRFLRMWDRALAAE